MKVTKSIYDTVKQGFDVDLSKRTIKNIKNSKDYNEYRRKYCNKKSFKNIATINDINDIARIVDVCSNRVEDRIIENNRFMTRLSLIQLLVTVVGFSVIIALIAW